MEVAHSHPCARRTMAGPSDRCMPNSSQAPSAAHAAPSTSARSNMRYGLLAVVLIGVATLGGCTDGVLDPKGPIAAADRQILLNALGIMLAIVIPLILPVGTPVSLELTSSGVMNSFFVPQLGSQIYTMAGMITRLHLQADHPGTYRGFSAQFSGEGFSDMHFDADAVTNEKFAQWLDSVRIAGPELDAKTYADLAKPSASVTPFTYRSVAPGLFASILVSEMQSDDAMCRRYPTSMRAEK